MAVPGTYLAHRWTTRCVVCHDTASHGTRWHTQVARGGRAVSRQRACQCIFAQCSDVAYVLLRQESCHVAEEQKLRYAQKF